MARESGLGQQLSLDNLNSLEKLTIEGDSPVRVKLILSSRVKRDTRNPARILGDPPLSLSTLQCPIVNKYREGKVKRTPIRGVK